MGFASELFGALSSKYILYFSEILFNFLDNAKVHHSKKLKRISEKYKIYLLFNAPNSPEANPIEKYLKK